MAIEANLSQEQTKRMELLSQYEDLTKPDRESRNQAIDNFHEGWNERWMKLQNEIDQARVTRNEALTNEGATKEQIESILSLETAKLIEKFEVEKDAEAREVEKGLVKPKLWVDFLREKSIETPEDPIFKSLIEEAEKSPNAGIEGLEGTPAKAVALDGLTHKINKDGSIEYRRGSSVAIRDVGDRLDISKQDNKDIEAALKIASQKFNMEKGLMLTGDIAFKARTAEIAGRLGLPLQNSEPEVLMAYKKGQAQNKEVGRANLPSVERGITGELAIPKPLAELNGPVLLHADKATLENAEALNLKPNGEGVVSMSSERVLKANANIRELPVEALRTVGAADLSKADGGFTDEEKKQLSEYGLIDKIGNLTPEAKDVVVVRDDRVKTTRDLMGSSVEKAFGKYQTSSEVVQEKSGKRDLEMKHEADVIKEKKQQNEVKKEQGVDDEKSKDDASPFSQSPIEEQLKEQAAEQVQEFVLDKAPQQSPRKEVEMGFGR